MASILLLKRRIQAAQNVSKTTRAMQMISASKLKKAQNATVSIRPYVEKLTNLTQGLVLKSNEPLNHPYMKERTMAGKTLLIALSPDKGLCGGLITNLLKEFLHFKETEKNSQFIVFGKKIQAQVAYMQSEVIASFTFGNNTPTFDMVYPITKLVEEYYLSEKVDKVLILSTFFVSLFSQLPKITQLLPIIGPSEQPKDQDLDYLFEPPLKEILPDLLNHYVEMTIYRNLLESFVSEQAARMITMQNATNNAKDIIEDLRLEYNKTRQAKITSEILDISGASTSEAEG